jgi:integrase
MLLPLKAIISKKQRKDGNSLIYFQYCYSSTNRVLLSTDIAIPFSFWNGKRQCVSKLLPAEFGQAEMLNGEITRMHKVIEAIIEHGKKMDAQNIGEYVKQIFSPTFDIASIQDNATAVPIRKKEPDLLTELDEYIMSKIKKVTHAGICNFKSLRDHLLAFQEFRQARITFKCLDYNFYLEFVEFLTYDYKIPRTKIPTFGLKVNTIGRTIKQLRVFIKDRIKRKVINYICMDDFKIMDEESDAVYLSYEEIGQIFSLDLSGNPTFALYRDMFVFGCLTGLRFSDYSTLRFQDYRNGLLFKKTDKVNTWVAIPLRTEAVEIFNKHFKNNAPVISNIVFNRYIKKIALDAGITQPITFSYKKGNKDIVVTKPKAEWITTHACRRSFCTNEFLQGTEISLIMKISGHKTMREFQKYVRINHEQAAHKIQEIWTARGGMSAFTHSKSL